MNKKRVKKKRSVKVSPILFMVVIFIGISALTGLVFFLFGDALSSQFIPQSAVVPELPALQLTGILENTEYRYREISWISKKRFLEKGELVFRYYVDVRAGIDLREVTQEVTEEGGLILSLPAPAITALDMDENSLEVLYEDKYYFKSLPRSEWTGVIETRKAEIRQEALDEGILDDARRQSGEFLTHLALNGGFQDVTLQWREPQNE